MGLTEASEAADMGRGNEAKATTRVTTRSRKLPTTTGLESRPGSYLSKNLPGLCPTNIGHSLPYTKALWFDKPQGMRHSDQLKQAHPQAYHARGPLPVNCEPQRSWTVSRHLTLLSGSFLDPYRIPETMACRILCLCGLWGL